MNRKLIVTAAMLLALAASPLYAAFTLGGDFYTEINGLWSDPTGLFYGTYLQGSGADGWGYDPTTLGAYTIPASTGAGNGNARDYYWVHDASAYDGPGVDFDGLGVIGNHPDLGLWFDLGGAANKVVVFGFIDHGPLPFEALEHTVYLSDDLATWTRAKLETTYTDGWDANLANIADGHVGVYSLGSSQTFRYASVVWGGASSIHNDGDTEIDAVAGLSESGQALPEPATLGLMGLGLAALASRLRRRK